MPSCVFRLGGHPDLLELSKEDLAGLVFSNLLLAAVTVWEPEVLRLGIQVVHRGVSRC